MKRLFYYAELDLTAELKQGKDGFLDGLTINEFNGLSLCLHSAITDFLLVRALLATDVTDNEVARLEQEPNRGGRPNLG